MAPAFVNNASLPPESAYVWLNPGIFSSPKHDAGVDPEPSVASPTGLTDFQFGLAGPVTMLPADELFSDGKLIPLYPLALRPPADTAAVEIYQPEGIGSGGFVLSPKASRCTSRWRELLGLKWQKNPKPNSTKEASPTATCPGRKSFTYLLHHRYSKTSINPSLSLPPLRDAHRQATAAEAAAISSRFSHFSNSSPHAHKDLPRLSLDSEKPRNPVRARVSRPKSDGPEGHFPARVPEAGSLRARGVYVDSPRMDPSGRIIFHGLERSSSSPSSFNGWLRTRQRGMERSYSANVRVPSVLNVHVGSLRGSWNSPSVFGLRQIFSQQRKEMERPYSSSSAAAAARPAKQRPRGTGKGCALGREEGQAGGGFLVKVRKN